MCRVDLPGVRTADRTGSLRKQDRQQTFNRIHAKKVVNISNCSAILQNQHYIVMCIKINYLSNFTNTLFIKINYRLV